MTPRVNADERCVRRVDGAQRAEVVNVSGVGERVEQDSHKKEAPDGSWGPESVPGRPRIRANFDELGLNHRGTEAPRGGGEWVRFVLARFWSGEGADARRGRDGKGERWRARRGRLGCGWRHARRPLSEPPFVRRLSGAVRWRAHAPPTLSAVLRGGRGGSATVWFGFADYRRESVERNFRILTARNGMGFGKLLRAVRVGMGSSVIEPVARRYNGRR